MAEIWFWIVSVTVALYVVLDGFDFGAGVLHLFVARTDTERREVLGAIGPLWDGNEVWLLAGGGVLFLAFPKVLAAGFSGFYLAMFQVVWCLILRGVSIEFRSHVRERLWRTFWDGAFAFASILLPILLGAALGNVLRGVPLNASGHFNLPLFTHWGTVNPVGILDWYTVLLGMFALLALALHGAFFLAWKTQGAVHDRSLRAARGLLWGVVALWPVVTVATGALSPYVFERLTGAPLAWLAVALAAGGMVTMVLGTLSRTPFRAFLGSCAFLLGLLASAAAMVYPVMLPSTLGPEWALTALNASSPPQSLRVGLFWWALAFPLAVLYFVNLFRLHRGKVAAAVDGEGY